MGPQTAYQIWISQGTRGGSQHQGPVQLEDQGLQHQLLGPVQGQGPQHQPLGPVDVQNKEPQHKPQGQALKGQTQQSLPMGKNQRGN